MVNTNGDNAAAVRWCREPVPRKGIVTTDNYATGVGFFFIVWERFYSPKPLFYKGGKMKKKNVFLSLTSLRVDSRLAGGGA